MTDLEPQPLPLEKAMSGVLALMASDRVAAERDDLASERRPTEVVLAEVGLSLAEIAQVTGRKYEGVKTTIRRYRERASKSGPK
jgi:DNA-directed RNA polymerase specialized sigma24 family protein